MRITGLFAEVGGWWTGLVLLVFCQASQAGILHVGESGPGSPGTFVGSWAGGSASCIAVDSQHVVLSKHQGGGVGTSVSFGDRNFRVEDIWSHESLDLRVARIESTDGSGVLDQWAHVSYGQAETGLTVRTGGFGRTNASTLLSDSGVPYGYQWTETGGELTWGANIVDRTYGLLGSGDDAGYMYISFDDVNEGNYLPGEIGLATGDSGGGWFVQEEGGLWRAAGMTISTDRSGATRFRDPVTLDPDPDRSYALRLGPAASWIRAVINGTCLPGDADCNGLVNFADYVIVSTHFGQNTDSWSQGDFNGDGKTDGADLQILRTHYGQLSSSEDPVVPEPSSLVLLAGGVLGCLLRKGRRPAGD